MTIEQEVAELKRNSHAQMGNTASIDIEGTAETPINPSIIAPQLTLAGELHNTGIAHIVADTTIVSGTDLDIDVLVLSGDCDLEEGITAHPPTHYCRRQPL